MGAPPSQTGIYGLRIARALLDGHPTALEQVRAFVEHLDGAVASAAPATWLGPWARAAAGAAVGGFVARDEGELDSGLYDGEGQRVAAPTLPAALWVEGRWRGADHVAVAVGERFALVLSRGGRDDALCRVARAMGEIAGPLLAGATRVLPEIKRQAVADARLVHRLRLAGQLGPTVAEAPSMRAATAGVARLAALGLPALIHGERGVGKSALARIYAAVSPRGGAPIEVVDCAALAPEEAGAALFGVAGAPRAGRLMRPRAGVLVLDRVDALAPPMQARLRRALDGWSQPLGAAGPERPIEPWVVATTDDELVESSRLRLELRQRLGPVVRVAPLRQRPADVMAMTRRWLRHAAARRGYAARQVAPDALDALCALPLSGNGHTLRRLVLGAVTRSLGPDEPALTAAHLPRWVRRSPRVESLGARLSAFEAREAPSWPTRRFGERAERWSEPPR